MSFLLRTLSVVVSLCAVLLGACTALAPHAATQAPPAARSVKVATVQFGPRLGDIDGNRERLVALTEQAAHEGARIVVHTEMATSGYGFFSRHEIAAVAETVPGPTTNELGQVAKHYGIYVAVGIPIVEPSTGRFFNSAVLIGPSGKVIGVYHKRNNLLEASYNAEESAPLPTFQTPYGRLAIVICADVFYPGFPRLAAVSGARILLAPANVGIDAKFLSVRAIENDMSIVVANRYGNDGKGNHARQFTQDTFAIPSPFDYEFKGSHSIIERNDGTTLADVSGDSTAIAYADVPILSATPQFPVVRRPDLYALIGQDTLEPYTFSQFGLPRATTFFVAALSPNQSANRDEAAVEAVSDAIQSAKAKSLNLRLIVLPENYLATLESPCIDKLRKLSISNNVDVVVGIAGRPPISYMIESDGSSMTYRRTHRGRTELLTDEVLGHDFWIVDRDYARVALLQDMDLLAPETAMTMEKMGVDVLAVSADSALPILPTLWKERTASYLHIVAANKQGLQGIYLGGYVANPSAQENDHEVMMQINTADVRKKPASRFLDATLLLMPCRDSNC